MALAIGSASESLGRLLKLLKDFRRHKITAAAIIAISKTMATPAPMAMPIKSAVSSRFPPPEPPLLASFVVGGMVTAAPVDPVDAVRDDDKLLVLWPPSAPPATFVDPVDDDGNIKDVEKVDSNGGTTVAVELTRLVKLVELVGSGITGGGMADEVVELDGGGATGGVDKLIGGGVDVEVVKLTGGGVAVEVVVSANGAVVGGSGAAADAVTMSVRPHRTCMSSTLNSLETGAGALTVSPGT